jgi:hypothetical protein
MVCLITISQLHTLYRKVHNEELHCLYYSANIIEKFHSYFVFGRYRVQILARKQTILTKDFRGFSQTLQANAGIIP